MWPYIFQKPDLGRVFGMPRTRFLPPYVHKTCHEPEQSLLDPQQVLDHATRHPRGNFDGLFVDVDPLRRLAVSLRARFSRKSSPAGLLADIIRQPVLGAEASLLQPLEVTKISAAPAGILEI